MSTRNIRHTHRNTHTHTHTHTHMHTLDYYSTIKQNEIFPFATTWMDLEGIMLSEINQIEKHKYCMSSLIMWNLKSEKNE